MDLLADALTHGGHPGGSYSTFRILKALVPWLRPTDLVLSSKGHDHAAFLAWKGGDPSTYRQVNGWPGHPERGTCGAIVSTGSLGMGLSKAVGLAWADRSRRVLCIVGDGECQEGQVWEAAQNALQLQLSNLIVLIDANGGQSENRPAHDPLAVFAASGWAVEIPDSLCWSVRLERQESTQRPLAVLWRSVKDHPHSLSRRAPMVDAYSVAIDAAMCADSRLVLLEADLAYDHGVDEAMRFYPDRVISCGICEQHMVSMAVGLAAQGYHPVCHTFARFYLRAADQIVDALNEPGLAIRFVGGLAGPLPIGPGPSHETDLDTALFRCRTYTPRTPEEVGPMVQSMLKQPRSTYLRFLAQPELA